MSIKAAVERGIAWNTAGTIAGKFVIFANVFLMLHFLTLYEYGLGQLVLSIVTALGIFMLPGLSSAILADLAVERGRKDWTKMKTLFWQFSTVSVLLALVAWVALFFGSNIAAHFYGNDAIGNLIKIASFLLLLSPLRTMTTMLASLELRYFDQSFYLILEEILKCAFLALFLVAFPLGLMGMLLAIVFSQAGAMLLYLPRSRSAYATFKDAPAPGASAFWHILHDHRKWSVATSYVGNLGQSIQIWIIKLMLGTEAVALFSFAQGIYGQVAAFLPLGPVLAPLLPRYVDSPADFARYLRGAIKVHFFISLALILATIIGAPVLVMIFPQYAPAEIVLYALIAGLLPNSTVVILTVAFNALKLQYSFFFSGIFKIAVTVVFLPIGIFLWGLPGASVALVLTALVYMTERVFRLERALPVFSISWRDLLSFDEYERAVVRQIVRAWRVRARYLKW